MFIYFIQIIAVESTEYRVSLVQGSFSSNSQASKSYCNYVLWKNMQTSSWISDFTLTCFSYHLIILLLQEKRVLYYS